MFIIWRHSISLDHRRLYTRISDMRRLFYICRGIRRAQGPIARPQRNPITPCHLRTMINFLGASRFSTHDKTMWRCVVLTAFFGLLRVSEYTTPTNHAFDPLSSLCLNNVTIFESSVNIRLKASKSDPFRAGVTIRLFAITSELCPVRALKDYTNIRQNIPHGPFFQLNNGRFLTRGYVAAFISLSLPRSVNINTHSFRIGGASTAASSGIPDSIIQIMGRWSSDCYRRYIRLDEGILRNWCTVMASTSTISTIWRFQ